MAEGITSAKAFRKDCAHYSLETAKARVLEQGGSRRSKRKKKMGRRMRITEGLLGLWKVLVSS